MILLYHSVISDDNPPERFCIGQAISQSAFKRQIRWLVSHYSIVSLDKYLIDQQQRGFRQHKAITLTLDDGLGLTFKYVYPLLIEMNIPVTIFISTGHLEHGELLWFNYLKALCFEKLYEVVSINQVTFPLRTLKQRKRAWTRLRLWAKSSGSPKNFCKALAEVYPLTAEVEAFYSGMTNEQIKLASESGMLELGAHTVTHPYLDQKTRTDQEEEILMSRRVLSEISGKPIRYFAYPNGDYNHDTVELVQSAGFEASFAIIPKKLGLNPQFEIGRIGVYSQSLLKLQLKTLGVADWARRFGLRVG